MKNVGARIDDEVYARLKKIAKERGSSISDVVREAIETYLYLVEGGSSNVENNKGREQDRGREQAPVDYNYIKGRLDAMERVLEMLLERWPSSPPIHVIPGEVIRDVNVRVREPPPLSLEAENKPQAQVEQFDTESILEEIMDNPWVDILKSKVPSS